MTTRAVTIGSAAELVRAHVQWPGDTLYGGPGTLPYNVLGGLGGTGASRTPAGLHATFLVAGQPYTITVFGFAEHLSRWQSSRGIAPAFEAAAVSGPESGSVITQLDPLEIVGDVGGAPPRPAPAMAPPSSPAPWLIVGLIVAALFVAFGGKKS